MPAVGVRGDRTALIRGDPGVGTDDDVAAAGATAVLTGAGDRSGARSGGPGGRGREPGRRPGRIVRTLLLARRHWGLLALLIVAAAARAVVTAAYATALWFPDSATYLYRAEVVIQPAIDRPWGYSAVLNVLDRFLGFGDVAVAQHVAGLIMIVLVYGLLQRRGVRRWISLLAVVPLAFDAYVLDIEHFILAETLFMVLLAVATFALLARERPGWLLAGTVGLLMGAMTLTRTVGLFLVGVVLVYLVIRLLLRTVRWTALVAFAVGVAAMLVPYAAWFDSTYGSFGLTAYTGHFLYGRVGDFVRCEELDLPARLRPLCPTAPPAEREGGDDFVWSNDSPANATRNGVPVWSEDDLRQFSLAAIEGQPEDYLHTILSETGHYLMPGRVSSTQDTCPKWWRFVPPARTERDNCTPMLAPGTHGYSPRLVHDLAAYQRFGYTPGPVLGVCLVAGFGALFLRRRSWRDRLDPALLAAVGLACLVGPAATASFDYRYLLPALVVLPPAAALATRRLSFSRAPRPGQESPVGP
jgi:hypothetical protein